MDSFARLESPGDFAPARVKVVHIEASYEALFERNRRRDHSVPMAGMERLMDRWDPPAVWEAPVAE